VSSITAVVNSAREITYGAESKLQEKYRGNRRSVWARTMNDPSPATGSTQPVTSAAASFGAAPTGGPPPDPDLTLWANARAITFRLLGEIAISERAAGDAVIQTQQLSASGLGSWAADPRWMTVLAVVAVERSLVLDVAGTSDHPELAPKRRELRRRLALVEPALWTAPVVHHLAGYPATDTAALLGRPVEEIRREVLLFDPSWDFRELGQAQTLTRPLPASSISTDSSQQRTTDSDSSQPDEPNSKRPRRKWSLSGMAVVVMLATVGAGITVTTLFPGQRATTVGKPLSTKSEHVGRDVPALPSAGCGSSDEFFGVSNPTVKVNGSNRQYRLSLPNQLAKVGESRSPATLIIAIPPAGQSAADFAEVNNLEAAPVAVATLEPVPPFRTINIDQDVQRPDDIAYALAVTDNVIASRCIDLRRVHLVGSGVGGRLAGALGCIRPTIYASVASVGEAFLPQPCVLDSPVSLLSVPTNLGANVSNPADLVAVADAVAPQWARAIETTKAPLTHSGPNDTVVTDWTQGQWGSFVRSMTVPAGQDVWATAVTEETLAFAAATARAN